MHLSYTEARDFVDLWEAFASYVASQIRFDEPPADDLELDERVLEYIEAFPEVVDGFIADANLTGAKASTVRDWKYAKMALGQACGFLPSGNLLLASDMGVVEVTGISRELSELVDVPSMVSLPLVPYGDRIVYGENIGIHPVEVGPNMTGYFAEMVDKAETGGTVISNAVGLITAVSEARVREAEASEERFESEMRQRERLRTGEMTPGLHVGVCAGHAPSERMAVAWPELANLEPGSRIDDDTYRRFLADAVKRAVKRAPSTDFYDIVSAAHKDRLLDLCMLLRIPVGEGAKKRDLVEAINAQEATFERMMVYVTSTLAGLDGYFLPKVGEAVHAGGSFTIDASDRYGVSALASSPLAGLGVYYDKASEVFTVTVPDFMVKILTSPGEIASTFGEVMTEGFYSRVDKILDLYGILEVGELAEVYAQVATGPVHTALLANFFLMASVTRDWVFWDRVFEAEDSVSIGCGNLVFDLEELDEETAFKCVGRLVVDRTRYDRAPLGTLADPSFESFEDWLYARPAVAELIAWCDAHVPEGADDYEFALDVVDDIYESFQLGWDVDAVGGIIETHGQAYDLDDTNLFVGHVMRAYSQMPQWSMYGNAPEDIHTGPKIFYDELQRPMKVGRNDPCPCGSGKKYKKCCGRNR